MTSLNSDVCQDAGRDSLPARGLDRRRSLALLLSMGLPLAHAQTELTDLARIRASGVLKASVSLTSSQPPSVYCLTLRLQATGSASLMPLTVSMRSERPP